jgi:RES domain-containing protein
MIVFRLSKSKYALDISGKGAEQSGGRWNSKGITLLYTSESRALCTTEIAVHTPLGNIPLDYQIVSIEIPDDIKVEELLASELPEDWKSLPHSHSTQEIGDKFVHTNKFLVLKVPSVVVQEEYNFLINPNHKDFKRIHIKLIEPFNFDGRLFIR